MYHGPWIANHFEPKIVLHNLCLWLILDFTKKKKKINDKRPWTTWIYPSIHASTAARFVRTKEKRFHHPNPNSWNKTVKKACNAKGTKSIKMMINNFRFVIKLSDMVWCFVYIDHNNNLFKSFFIIDFECQNKKENNWTEKHERLEINRMRKRMNNEQKKKWNETEEREKEKKVSWERKREEKLNDLPHIKAATDISMNNRIKYCASQ